MSDHRVRAEVWLNTAEGPELSPEETVATAAIAQAHATLAVAEQLRAQNLIALGQFRIGPDDLPPLRHLVTVPSGEYYVRPTALIRDLLEL